MSTDTSTSTLEHTDTDAVVDPSNGDGDHDLFAHYVSKDDLGAYWMAGILPTALCGKKWAPTKDPSRYGVCPTCKEVYGLMQAGDPDSPDYQGDQPTPMEPPC